MDVQNKTSAIQACEKVLCDNRNYNIERSILPSENKVIDRLLDRGVEMVSAYEELTDKLALHPPALEVFLGLVLSAAALWNPEKMRIERKNRKRLQELKVEIASVANKLADLVKRRSETENSSSFSGDTHYSMCGVIEAAGSTHHLFRSHVEDQFKALHDQFDLKYWPSLEECIREIGADSSRAVIESTNPITASGTTSPRTSLSDFFRALFRMVGENRAHLPRGFSLTDNTWATLANCALGLDDEMVDSNYVKNVRQSIRNNR